MFHFGIFNFTLAAIHDVTDVVGWLVLVGW